MQTTNAYSQFLNKVEDLEITIREFNEILISENPVSFIYSNANFLTKSFLINLCGYLETYLKDVLETLLVNINAKLISQRIPYNLIRWNIEQKPKSDSKINSLLDSKNCREGNIELKIKKKDLDSFISGNPFRTKELFKMFGIDLERSQDFNNAKEFIKTIVERRNNILHHNDEASDLSILDINIYIVEIKKYTKLIDFVVLQTITNA